MTQQPKIELKDARATLATAKSEEPTRIICAHSRCVLFQIYIFGFYCCFVALVFYRGFKNVACTNFEPLLSLFACLQIRFNCFFSSLFCLIKWNAQFCDIYEYSPSVHGNLLKYQLKWIGLCCICTAADKIFVSVTRL